ncbi:unnamed protein product [Cuscuta campestris]|uniref:Uncharacterized protein n=1 Tax=Cuscuta campestris TaxID=132261 RepID=A0A484M8L5_9ASTE|nr:unnamed protein product [Cuscuta campestris]
MDLLPPYENGIFTKTGLLCRHSAIEPPPTILGILELLLLPPPPGSNLPPEHEFLQLLSDLLAAIRFVSVGFFFFIDRLSTFLNFRQPKNLGLLNQFISSPICGCEDNGGATQRAIRVLSQPRVDATDVEGVVTLREQPENLVFPERTQSS